MWWCQLPWLCHWSDATARNRAAERHGRDADCSHTHNSRYPRRPLGLHQSYICHTQRPPTVTFCYPAGSRYIGPLTATSNTLHNIQTQCHINQRTFATHANDTDCVMREEYAQRSNASHSPITERILAEAGAYYTLELVFSPSTAMKSRHAYYTQVHIMRDFTVILPIFASRCYA